MESGSRFTDLQVFHLHETSGRISESYWDSRQQFILRNYPEHCKKSFILGLSSLIPLVSSNHCDKEKCPPKFLKHL